MTWTPFEIALTVAAVCGLLWPVAWYVKRLLHRRLEAKAYGDLNADSAPSPLELQQVREVIAQAEKAAAQHALGEPATNPHPRGTRMYVLWETQFQRMLMEFTHDTRKKPPVRGR